MDPGEATPEQPNEAAALPVAKPPPDPALSRDRWVYRTGRGYRRLWTWLGGVLLALGVLVPFTPAGREDNLAHRIYSGATACAVGLGLLGYGLSRRTVALDRGRDFVGELRTVLGIPYRRRSCRCDDVEGVEVVWHERRDRPTRYGESTRLVTPAHGYPVVVTPVGRFPLDQFGVYETPTATRRAATLIAEHFGFPKLFDEPPPRVVAPPD